MGNCTEMKKHNAELQKQLGVYKKRMSEISKVKVYDSDKEIADTIATIPHDKDSVKRYRSYFVAIKFS